MLVNLTDGRSEKLAHLSEKTMKCAGLIWPSWRIQQTTFNCPSTHSVTFNGCFLSSFQEFVVNPKFPGSSFFYKFDLIWDDGWKKKNYYYYWGFKWQRRDTEEPGEKKKSLKSREPTNSNHTTKVSNQSVNTGNQQMAKMLWCDANLYHNDNYYQTRNNPNPSMLVI